MGATTTSKTHGKYHTAGNESTKSTKAEVGEVTNTTKRAEFGSRFGCCFVSQFRFTRCFVRAGSRSSSSSSLCLRSGFIEQGPFSVQSGALSGGRREFVERVADLRARTESWGIDRALRFPVRNHSSREGETISGICTYQWICVSVPMEASSRIMEF